MMINFQDMRKFGRKWTTVGLQTHLKTTFPSFLSLCLDRSQRLPVKTCLARPLVHFPVLAKISRLTSIQQVNITSFFDRYSIQIINIIYF